MSRYRGERGNVAPLAVALCLVLVMTLGFLADCAVLYGAKARQEQALDAARSACMDAGQAASAKYSDDAGAVLADLIARDERDSNRAIAPLRPADDAVLLDTSGMTLQESIDAILKLIRKKVTV